MSAREQFPGMARIGVVASNIDARTPLKIECGEALDVIDALRARVVVAEEDSDRLAQAVKHAYACRFFERERCNCGISAVLDQHAVAVSSRPKATE